jgi:Na+/melibiose symporter-like transporter
VPLYLLEICGRSVDEVASVPILMYLSQIVGAVGAERLCLQLGKPRVLLLDALVSALASLSLRCLPTSAWVGIVCAVCVQALAASGALVLVVAMQADAARTFPKYGHGFLYGTHSMLDKVSSGLAIVFLQNFAQRSGESGTDDDGMARPGGAATRGAFTIGACLVPLCAALCAVLLTLDGACKPLTAPPSGEGEEAQRRRRSAEAEHLEADVLSRPLLPAHP